MDIIELQAEPRTVFGKNVKSLREQGLVPAEIYGRKTSNISIQVPQKVLAEVLAKAGKTHLINIKVGNEKGIPALARKIQLTPIKRQVGHVDFYAVVMTDTVAASVPVVIVGENDLITHHNGSLLTGLSEVVVEALPDHLPETIEVDISSLKEFSDAIHAADLALPQGVMLHSSPDSLIVSIQAPRLAEEPAAAATPAPEE